MVVTKTGLHQLYPYVYVATYEIKKSLRSYCGRSLIFHAENNLGSSVFTTLVMVKCKLSLFFASIDFLTTFIKNMNCTINHGR